MTEPCDLTAPPRFTEAELAEMPEGAKLVRAELKGYETRPVGIRNSVLIPVRRTWWQRLAAWWRS